MGYRPLKFPNPMVLHRFGHPRGVPAPPRLDLAAAERELEIRQIWGWVSAPWRSHGAGPLATPLIRMILGL